MMCMMVVLNGKIFNIKCKKYKNEMIKIIKKSPINKQKYIKKYLL